MLTNSTSTFWSAYLVANVSKYGSSLIQGLHQVAQKFTTYILPSSLFNKGSNSSNL